MSAQSPASIGVGIQVANPWTQAWVEVEFIEGMLASFTAVLITVFIISALAMRRYVVQTAHHFTGGIASMYTTTTYLWCIQACSKAPQSCGLPPPVIQSQLQIRRHPAPPSSLP